MFTVIIPKGHQVVSEDTDEEHSLWMEKDGERLSCLFRGSIGSRNNLFFIREEDLDRLRPTLVIRTSTEDIGFSIP